MKLPFFANRFYRRNRSFLNLNVTYENYVYAVAFTHVKNGRCGEIPTSNHFFCASANEIVRRLFNVFGEKAVSQSSLKLD